MTLLNMNIAKIFLIINHMKLIHNFWIKKCSIESLIECYCLLKIKTLCSFHKSYYWKTNYMHKIITKFIYVIHIVFVFQCRFAGIDWQIENKIITINFVNNIDLLIYKKFIKKNYVILKCIYFICIWWTKRHNMIFIFEKYELIHLLYKTKCFNMRATMKFNNVTVESKINIKLK